jgi:hypothetical protein
LVSDVERSVSSVFSAATPPDPESWALLALSAPQIAFALEVNAAFESWLLPQPAATSAMAANTMGATFLNDLLLSGRRDNGASVYPATAG